jgi:ribonuclease BN (tRNA processing enzyme)
MIGLPTENRFPYDPERIAAACLAVDRRLMLFGQPGIGKTTLARALAQRLVAEGRRVWCLSADPGSPVFGLPGTVSLGCWREGTWSLQAMEAICSLDAARFRLPLFSAVAVLSREVKQVSLILDAPGVHRGVAGAELLTALTQAAEIDLVMLLLRADKVVPLPQELRALQVEQVRVDASPLARRPGKRKRARNRTRLWDEYLAEAPWQSYSFGRLSLLGTPPRKAPDAWVGKQIGLLKDGRTLGMGEVIAMQGEVLKVQHPSLPAGIDALLVRDAGRDQNGLLSTGKPFAERLVRYFPPPDLLPDMALGGNGGVRPLVHLGTAVATLVNGVFGDPLLHLRLRHQRRSLLFDLGEGFRLPARIAHQVTDVFITHAHIDHISGFLWLLRSRIGEQGVCRLYGPPGLAENVSGLINGIHWDRIGDRGPGFEVSELHGDRLRRFRLQAGSAGLEFQGETIAKHGVLLCEPDFLVRATTLDHGTPVLAYAYEAATQINIRKERLLERQLPPGPWLNELKTHLHADERDTLISLPDGGVARVAELAEALTLVTPGSKLVYATDFADSRQNREDLHNLALEAHTLFCEATFLEQEAEQARRTGHLTTRACGEIASRAAVRHLIPFHISRRYEEQSWRVYEEIARYCPQLVMPRQS